MALGRNLWQVGYAEHLPARTQRAQFLAHDFRHGAADAGIHFVEHHGARRAGQAGHLYGQRQARQFAAGGDLGQWPQRLAGVGRNAEFDLIQSM